MINDVYVALVITLPGSAFIYTMQCMRAGTVLNYYRPTVAGIHGNEHEGCYSLALSGGYEDDVDYGVCFTYTGEGTAVLSTALTIH